MDNKQFKSIVENSLIQHGFIKKGPFYYVRSDDVICVIGLQKSKYSGGYYINAGYLIAKLNPTLTYPADVDCDIRTRFNFVSGGKLVDLFKTDSINSETKLTDDIEKNIEVLITNTNNIDGLRQMIQDEPTLLYQTKLSARKYLGLDD